MRNVLEKAFPQSTFVRTHLHCFSEVLMPGDDYSNWFTQVLLFFPVKSYVAAKGEKELAFVKYFMVATPMEEIDREVRCLSHR